MEAEGTQILCILFSTQMTYFHLCLWWHATLMAKPSTLVEASRVGYVLPVCFANFLSIITLCREMCQCLGIQGIFKMAMQYSKAP